MYKVLYKSAKCNCFDTPFTRKHQIEKNGCEISVRQVVENFRADMKTLHKLGQLR
jgi:hypothetical protein